MKRKRLDEIIRVDHAGEHGAIAIYKGQLTFLNLIGDKKPQLLYQKWLRESKSTLMNLIGLLKREKRGQLP